MRKRPAAVLLGMFVIVTSTYMAWCALPCLKPMFIYDKDVPDDARQVINAWRKTSKYIQAEPPEYFIQSLCEPFRMKFEPMEVEMDGPGSVYIRNGVAGIRFERDARGAWQGRIHSCSGVHPVF